MESLSYHPSPIASFPHPSQFPMHINKHSYYNYPKHGIAISNTGRDLQEYCIEGPHSIKVWLTLFSDLQAAMHCMAACKQSIKLGISFFVNLVVVVTSTKAQESYCIASLIYEPAPTNTKCVHFAL